MPVTNNYKHWQIALVMYGIKMGFLLSSELIGFCQIDNLKFEFYAVDLKKKKYRHQSIRLILYKY